MLRNYFLINLILLIIVGMLGFRFYKTWAKPVDIPTQGVKQSAQKDKKAVEGKAVEEKKEAGLNEALYNVIVQKDLFRFSRSAPQVEDIPPQFFTNPPKLFGTIIMGNEKSALLEDPNTKTTRLYRVNDSFVGFTVSDIQENKVVLTRGDKTLEVKLREIKTVTMPRQQPFPPQQFQRPIPQTVPQPFPQPVPQQPQPQVHPRVVPQPQPPSTVQRPAGLPERPVRVSPVQRRATIPTPPVAAHPQPVAPSGGEESQPSAGEQPQGEEEPEGEQDIN